MGLLLFVATIAFVGLSVVLVIAVRLYQKRIREIAGALALAFAGWCALYGTLLVSASLASEPRVLSLDEDKRFCGFYLDCHLHAAVIDIDSAPRVGSGSTAVQARGTFVLVTLRISSDARRAAVRFVGPRAVIRDDRQRTFPRSLEAEAAMARIADRSALTETIPAGQSILATLVFDVPADAHGLMLDLTDGYTVDRWIETFLIGDDDSLLHSPTLFRLTRMQ